MNPMASVPTDRPITLHIEGGEQRVCTLECIEGGCELTGEGWVFVWCIEDGEEKPSDWDDGCCWEHSRKPIGWSEPDQRRAVREAEFDDE